MTFKQDKRKYTSPKLIAVAIDQEIALVMMSDPIPWDGEGASANPASNPSSEIFGGTETTVGSNTINWDKD